MFMLPTFVCAKTIINISGPLVLCPLCDPIEFEWRVRDRSQQGGKGRKEERRKRVKSQEDPIGGVDLTVQSSAKTIHHTYSTSPLHQLASKVLVAWNPQDVSLWYERISKSQRQISSDLSTINIMRSAREKSSYSGVTLGEGRQQTPVCKHERRGGA